MSIEFPITVESIDIHDGYSSYKPGGLAEVRPCGDEYNGKTYIGLFLGDLPLTLYAAYDRESKKLSVSATMNPAIFVPELNKVIYGIESWWRRIEKIEDTSGIASEDIEDCWYVRLFNEMRKGEEQ